VWHDEISFIYIGIYKIKNRLLVRRFEKSWLVRFTGLYPYLSSAKDREPKVKVKYKALHGKTHCGTIPQFKLSDALATPSIERNTTREV
jgi:hypothetical protein